MEYTRNGRPRVVITGMSAITALGDIKATWEGLKAGRSGITRIETSFQYPPDFDVQIAGEIKDFDPIKYGVNPKEARRMARSSQMSVAATLMLLEDAGLKLDDIKVEGERVGVVVGSSMAGHDMAQKLTREWKDRGHKLPSPFGLVSSLPNMPAYYVSQVLGALGPFSALSTACATGTQVLGDGAELIRTGRADMIFAGGVESIITDYCIAGFAAMKALPTSYNDRPHEASRPFDADREGFVCSEGVAMMVLESLEHAEARGARVYAEVLGHASSSDAYHFAAPDPDGAGACRAMRWAIQDAHLNPEDIDYINAHGSSTPLNDKTETLAVKKVFGERAYRIPVNSTKSMLGHLLGAAGTIEAAACVMTIIEGILHPTINYCTPDPDCDLDYVPNVAREARVNVALSNSFGLGGQNACVVIGRA